MPAPLPNYAALPPNIILGGRPDPNQPALAARRPVVVPPAAPQPAAGQGTRTDAASPGISQSAPGGQGTRLTARVSPPAPSASAPITTSIPRISSPQIAAGARGSTPVQGPPDGGTRPTAIAAAPVSISPPVASQQAPTPGIASIGLPASPLQSTPPASAQPTRSERLAGLASVAAAIRALDERSGAAAPAEATPTQSIASNPPATPAPQQSTSPPAPPSAEAGPTLLAKRTDIPSPGRTVRLPPSLPRGDVSGSSSGASPTRRP
jgi:hypothetical protein